MTNIVNISFLQLHYSGLVKLNITTKNWHPIIKTHWVMKLITATLIYMYNDMINITMIQTSAIIDPTTSIRIVSS